MRVAHVALRVKNLNEAVDYYRDVLQLEETLRENRRSYLTCNERHHELILIESAQGGYDHSALEVDDAASVDEVVGNCLRAGGISRGTVDAEPGISGGEYIEGPGGHVF